MSGQVIEYKPTVKCDFCGVVKDEAEYLFQAPGGMTHVCDMCVEQMGIMLAMERNEKGKRHGD